VVLLFRTLCPASPSLQRVAWAVLPRLPDRHESSIPVIGTMLRYDCRTPVSGSFDFLFPSLIPCCSICLCSVSGSPNGGNFSVSAPGVLPSVSSQPFLYRETCGSPKFPDCPREHMTWSSGRNTARAPLGREFPNHAPFRYVRRVPSSTIAHVSASPPLIPDGRISRVRLAAMAFPLRPFPLNPKLKCLPTYVP
jgi:hypothetical protein